MGQSADFQGTDRFMVLTRLGQGGMGSVYQVVDRHRQTRVALKSVGHVAGDALLRFKREFRALQELHHPNVVELGELFEANGEWFFTMELVTGKDFFSHNRTDDSSDAEAAADSGATSRRADHTPPTASGFALTEAEQKPAVGEPFVSRLEAHPLTNPEIGFDEIRLRQSLAQLAQALYAVHRHGQVHRDVKPGNVLVADDGRVVLIDFGLTAGVRDVAITAEHHVVGTAAYMAPEQAAGGNVGPEADWYAVGVMLYEVLTGVKPHTGRGLQLLLRKQSEAPRAPRELVPGIPADLDALCMDLLEIDRTQRPTGREVLRRLHIDVTDPGPSSQPERTDDFVGRETELGALRDELGRVLDGQPAIVTVVGQSGLGKTALLRYFADSIERDNRDALVLQGRCYEQESVPCKALDGVMDQLSQWMKRLPDARLKSLLPDDVALLERAFPVLQRVPAIAKARRDLADVRDPQQLRIRVMRTLRSLFGTLARCMPLVVVIDDFQWSDEDSRRMLDELISPPDAPPLMLVFAARAEDQVRSTGRAVRLGPLSEEQSIDLALRLSRHVGDVERARAEAVARQAEGFPFFVEALLSGPPTRVEERLDLDEVITGAVRALPSGGRALLEVACIAGAPITQSLAASATATAPAEIGPQLKTLRRLRLVRTTGLRASDHVEPYHDRIRQTVLAHLGSAEQRRLHMGLAVALEAHEGEPRQIALHYRGAEDRAKATKFLLLAAAGAMRTLAFAHAADLYAEAESLGTLSPSELRRVRTERGRALASAGHGQAAARAYAAALDGASSDEAIDLRRRIAEQLFIAGYHEEGLAACDAFLAELRIDYPKTARRAFISVAGLEIFLRLRGLGFELQPAELQRPDELQRIDAYWSMARGLASHDPMRAQVFQSRGLLAALSAGEPHRIARALSVHALAIGFLDPSARARADEVLKRARALAEEQDLGTVRAQCMMVGALLDYIVNCRFTIDVAAAEAELRHKCEGVAWELDLLSILHKQCLYWRGEWRQLAVAVHDQIKEADERGDRYLSVQIRSHWQSFLAAIERDYERGHAEADFARSQNPAPVEALINLLSHARVDLCEGRGDVALERHESFAPGLMGSLMLKATIYRTMFETSRLASTLAAAEQATGDRRRERYALAEAQAKTLVRAGVDCLPPLQALARAALAAGRDRNLEAAIAQLQRAEAGFTAQSMLAHRAAAVRRRGQLLGGDEGKTLVAESEAWLAQQGVRDMPGVSRLLAPGFAVDA